MDKKKIIESYAADCITDKPIIFSIAYTGKETVKEKYGFLKLRKREKIVEREKRREFTLKPPTLGKMQILSKYYLALDFDEDALKKEPQKEIMRICESKTEVVCELLAAIVSNTKEELQDDLKLKELREFFQDNATPKDFGQIMLALLTQIDYENFTNSILWTKILRQNEPTQKPKGAKEIE